jgi:predicted TPR repeat methyltransferase
MPRVASKTKPARPRAAAKRPSRRAIAEEVKNLCRKAEIAREKNDYEASRVALERALALDPECSDAIWWMGDYWHTVNQREPALKFYRRYLYMHPGDAEALHMIASLGGRAVPKRASDEYLRMHFDSYAEDFDKSLLKELGYQAPKVLGATVLKARGSRAPKADICDIGCGTGLMGLELKGIARTLTGVDLSRKMAALTRARGIYDRVAVGEVTKFLRANKARYDIVVAADVLIYFGDITALFKAAARALRPGGLFAFTAESRRGGTYHLTVTGRYAHNPAWLDKVAAEAGFTKRGHVRAPLREEVGKPVPGYYGVMERLA